MTAAGPNPVIALARKIGLRRFWKRPAPGNLQSRDVKAARADAEYGFSCGQGFKRQLERFGTKIRGASVLEIGPGVGFGSAAYLAAHGADAAVADRWLAPWQGDYHGVYYQALADLVETEGAGGDPSLLRALAGRGDYAGGPIRLLRASAEQLPSGYDGAFDAICSNAVLEHLADLRRALARFYKLTRPGGLGVHQVDFRDHRDFQQPLEHLLMTPATFLKLSKSMHYEFGSQRRRADYADRAVAAGFAIEEYSSNDRANEAYLEAFVPRLRAALDSPWRATAVEELCDLGGLFILRRPA